MFCIFINSRKSGKFRFKALSKYTKNFLFRNNTINDTKTRKFVAKLDELFIQWGKSFEENQEYKKNGKSDARKNINFLQKTSSNNIKFNKKFYASKEKLFPSVVEQMIFRMKSENIMFFQFSQWFLFGDMKKDLNKKLFFILF